MVLADQAETEGLGRNKRSTSHLPTTREWLGFIVVFTLISAGADLGFDVAGGFALLVMLTMLLVRGPEAFEFLTGKFQGRKPPPKRKKTQTTPATQPKGVKA
jgi:hypothetical protein